MKYFDFAIPPNILFFIETIKISMSQAAKGRDE
jgi:hypothetical protein